MVFSAIPARNARATVGAVRLTSVTSPSTRFMVSRRHIGSTMHDNDPTILEVEKAKNLSNRQHLTSTPHDHAPGWNERLASQSESNVQADKSSDTPDVMTAKTIQYMNKSRAYDRDEAPDSTTAASDHDSVDGPLSSAGASHEQTLFRKTYREETVEVTQP
ncbi:hypothetical protein DL96DRAFT_1709757 [Flagelloscypha sp. PMI_526]|nr:hypothetical protein DL96DRAFT_1709757 [Flagelloscypha sp. PMI_526]